MKKRWISLGIALVLVLAPMLLGACNQRPPEEEPSESEVTAEPSTEAATEPETEPATEAETEPETEPETDPEPVTQPATEATAAATEPPDPSVHSGASDGVKLNPADFDLFAFRSGFEVQWYENHETINAQFAALVNKSTNAVAANADPNAVTEGDFLALLPGYQKAIYSLKGGALVAGDTAYQILPEDYAALKALYDDVTLAGPTYAQWLVYMDISRVTGIRWVTEGNNQTSTVTNSSHVEEAKALAHYFPVVPGSGETSSFVQRLITPKGNTYKLWLDFDDGTGQPGELFYTLTFEETTLLVESSDLGYGCQYTIAPGDAARLRSMLESPVDQLAPRNAAQATVPANGPPLEVPPAEPDPDYHPNGMTGKPVIYLYPEAATDVSVKLGFQGELGYTFPAYNGGWNVTAQPDGTLTNKADGSTHYYLFWDGVPEKRDWDFSEGFVVKGSELEGFFLEALPAMGLLPKEYNDFITYWTPKMQGNPYNLITFSTAEYEAVAPLTVSPAPDTVLRVHMVYKPLAAPVEVAPQALPAPPERDGFTLVEWGGTELGGKTA